MGDVLDRAVRGERPVLVLAAEERDLHPLALVLVRVVLHGAEGNGTPYGCVVARVVRSRSAVPAERSDCEP